MNRAFRGGLAAAALLAAGTAAGLRPSAARPDEPPTADEREFTALLEKCQADWCTPLDDPGKWYADDALVFDLIPPFEPYRGRAAYVAGAQTAFYDKMAKVVFKPTKVLRVVRAGDMALVEAFVHGTATPKAGGPPLEIDIRQTTVWQKRGGKWLIVHEHNSVPLKMAE